MLKFLIEAFKASKGRMPNNLEMLLLKQKAANQAIDERKIVNIFDRSSVNPNKTIIGGKNIPETEDDIRRRIMKQNEQGIANLKNKLDNPEKKAMGGRIGYKVGTGKKGVEGLIDLIRNKFGKKSITTADKAPIPPKTLERDMFKKADKRLNDKRMLDDDEYQDFLDEVGGADQLEAYDFDGTVGSAKKILKEQKQYMDDMELEYKKGNLDPVAGDKSPARKRFLEKKLEEMEMSGDKKLMTVDEIEELSSFDLGSEMDVAKSLAPKMVERLELKQKYPGITDDLLDKILIDDNMQRKAEVLATIDEAFKMMEKGKSADEILDTIKNVTRTKQADGGITRIGLKSGSYLYNKFKDLGLGKLFTSDKVAGVTMGEEGIAELLRLLSNSGMFADGGIARAGFVGGGMGRRGFLKLLGMTGAGIGAAKTGLMSLAKKSEPVVEAVKETVQEVPSYFFSLVNKIRTLGDDTLATQDKTIAKKYKDYVMEEDFAGNIEIIKKGDDVAEDVFMSYKVDEVPLKKGGSRKVEEYEEYTARPDMEGKMKNIEPGVPDNVVEEAMSQAPSIKKASGGIARMLGEEWIF